MGFLSGLVHAIGNGIGDAEDFFTGNNKKKQQSAPTQAPQQIVAPQSQNNQNNQNNQQNSQNPQNDNSAPTANGINLTMLNQNAAPPAANTLVKANQPPAQSPTQTAPAPPAQHASILHDITHNPLTNGVGSAVKNVGSAAAGTSLGVLRAGEGLVQGVTSLPDQILHATNAAGNAIASGITGSNVSGVPSWLQDVDKATKVVNTPIDALAKTTDQAAQAFGQTGANFYKPAQVATNIATILPGAAALLSKAPGLAAKLGDVADFAKTQSSSPTLSKVISAVKGGSPAPAAADVAAATPTANEVSSGIKSVNPAQSAPSELQGLREAAPAPVETPPPVTGPNGEEVPQVSAEAPNAVQPVVHTDNPARTELQNAANDTNVPAYQRTTAKNQLAQMDAAEEAAQEKALGVGDNPATDSPSYQRQGKALPSESAPTPAAINDSLNNNAAELAKDPASSAMVNQAFRETGNTNPLSLAAHTLASTSDKGNVRAIVQKLVPEANGNTLNRAVNTITGADNQADVLQALHEAGSEAKTPTGPLGKVSTAEAAKPNVSDVPEPSQAPEPVSSPPEAQPSIQKVSTTPQTQELSQSQGPAPLENQEHTIPQEVTQKPTDKIAQEQPSSVENSKSDSSSPSSVAQPNDNVNPNARTAANAPNVRKAALRELKPISDGLKKTDDVHEVFSNPELTAAGKAVTDTMSDQEILEKYSNPTKFVDPSDIAIANNAKTRLSIIAQNGNKAEREEAQSAINNIIDAAGEVQSRGGRIMNYGQEMMKNMPPEQRAAYYIKHIDDLNANVKGYTPLADDLPRRNTVEAALTEVFTKDQALGTQIAEKQSVLSKAGDPATRGDVSLQEMKNAQNDLQNLQKQQRLNAAEMTKTYSNLVPKPRFADKAGDWQRTSMLSSPTGRGRAIASTGLNVVDEGLKQGVSGVLGKINNALVKDPNKVNSTGMRLPTVLKGVVQGAKKSFNSARGTFEVDDPEKAIHGNPEETLSAMNKFTGGRIKRIVGSVVESHSNMTEGVGRSELERSARTEGLQQGLSGDDLKKYTIYRTEQPTPLAKANADEVHKTMNNLNNNPISNTLRAAGQAAEKNLGPVGKVIKNQILPFPTFLGGNIWNAVTDKNVLAAGIKVLHSAAIGDKQGVIDNIAKVGVEGGKSYALGWELTKHNVLTNKDANGKDYDGVYLHLGSRYIPIKDVGFFAPSMILGNAAYNGMNDSKNKGNVAKTIGDIATKSFGNAYRVLGGQSIMNPSASIGTPVSQSFSGSGADAPGQLAKVAGNVIGQNIPAATSDVNAFLNQSRLDPTHEAAETKVAPINPATGKAKTDPIATAKAVLGNKLPIFSQNLPRKAGIPAADPLDKFLSSTRETPTQVQTRLNNQTAADKVTADTKAGIPNPDAKYAKGDSFAQAVESRIEGGKYDQAITGLQEQLSKAQKVPDANNTTLDPIKKQLATAQVLKDGNYDPGIRKLYDGSGSVSVSAWRNMGDPNSAEYNPKEYQLLYNYDSQLAAKGASANTSDPTANKYTAKTASTTGRGSAASKAADLIKSNTLGTPLKLATTTLSNLAPQKISTVPILQKVLPSDLIKKRSISVARARA